ncbi:MAG TPA: type I-E CRISPR-associated protein Cas7/Cse4/CasC, partial [Polyangiaceae bacterium]
MTKPLFIQVHTLTSYPGALLNRDDVGFAKRMPFGGETRTRISSQCLKRHWRTFEGEHSLASLRAGEDPVALSVRSRHTFAQYVLAPLVEGGVSADLARAATEAVMVAVLGESAKAKKAKEESQAAEEPRADGEAAAKGKKKASKKEAADEGPASVMTQQVTVLGRPEIEFFLAEARALATDAGSLDKLEEAKKKRFTKEWGRNLDGLRRAAGLDAALFGRMVTSDKLSRADAAIHVAHAFTVHAERAETDYFAAIDDLTGTGDDAQLGSGHIGTTELTSGLFYGYVVVDVAQLVSNLEGCPAKGWAAADRKLAADVVASLVQLAARVTPGAKKGSTAPYACAHLTMVEAGSAQPRTLANAFLKPVDDRPDLIGNAYSALASYTTDVDQVFGDPNRRALAVIAATEAVKALGSLGSLDSVARFAAGAVVEHK